jgi:integrase-like protein
VAARSTQEGRDPFPEGLRFHDLRHTCAALLIAEGAHPRAIMERLGHSSITVTLNTYGHLFPSVDEALTDRLDRVFHASLASGSADEVAREWHGASRDHVSRESANPVPAVSPWALRDSNPRPLPCKGSALAS